MTHLLRIGQTSTSEEDDDDDDDELEVLDLDLDLEAVDLDGGTVASSAASLRMARASTDLITSRRRY
jgi:hypothetical protein